MRHGRERERKIDAVEAEVARQVKTLGIILVVLMILAVVALALVVGHIFQVPWLAHSP
jgi:hypothetical protein